MVFRSTCTVLVAAAAGAALAGCGGAGGEASRTVVTIPPYDQFPAATVTSPEGKNGDPAACRTAAAAFVDGAERFLDHFGQRTVYPADLYYVLMREALADFQTRGCDPTVLGAALERRLSSTRRRTLVDALPAPMAAALRESLAAASGSSG